MLLFPFFPYLNNERAKINCIVGVVYIFGMFDKSMTLLVTLLGGVAFHDCLKI